MQANAVPLNQLLLQWQEDYDLQFSFDDALLSSYAISEHRTYSDTEKALNALFQHLPLAFEKSGEVYVIFYQEKRPPAQLFRLIGQLVDKDTGEPLAYSVVSANGKHSITNMSGMFSFTALGDSVFKVQASHLGSRPLDTVLVANKRHFIRMASAMVKLNQVDVKGYVVENAVQIGYEPAQMSLNYYVARYLPGNGDNSVFDLLKMQPGVLASGEMANDFVIWGSYGGTSRVTFDGFPLWGLTNFNANISMVNPFIVKDVELLKGAYGADKDDVVGGFIAINGKMGEQEKPSAQIFVNNQTVNGAVELPITQQISLLTAYRQSYRTLLSKDNLMFFSNSNNADVKDFQVSDPNYLFRDYNAKLSYRNEKGDIAYLSFLRASDKLGFSTTFTLPRNVAYYEASEDNTQTGTSLYYEHTWGSGMRSRLNVINSSLVSRVGRRQSSTPERTQVATVRKDNHYETEVRESAIKWSNTVPVSASNRLNFGLDYTYNAINLYEDTFGISSYKVEEVASRMSLLMEDEHQFADILTLKGGLRYNYSNFLRKQYFDPRLSMTIPLGERFKTHLAWGKYHQFLVKSSTIDEDGNYHYRWGIANDEELKVMRSQQGVVELVYNDQGMMASVCLFYKEGDGVTRYIRNKQNEAIYSGQYRGKGLDLYLKKDMGAQALWLSYSLGKTEELFPYFKEGEYRLAPQNQTHELKLGSLLNYRDFHFSADYTLGSGFPVYVNYISPDYTITAYRRLDMALTYTLHVQFVDGELGISLLNVFDTPNVKFSSFERIPSNQTSTISIVNEAIPFTPLFFIKLKL